MFIDEISSAVAERAPLAVASADYQEPSLSLSGDSWSFSTLSPWRLLTADGTVASSWKTRDAREAVSGLIGVEIVGVRSQGRLLTSDPALVLSDGRRLEVFSDHHTDPWVLSVPGNTFVGSPSDPAWI